MPLSIRDEPQVVAAAEVPIWVRDRLYAQYPYVVTISILVYDSLITVDEEVKHFWRKPKSAIDVMYFINRYIAIFGAATCLLWNAFSTSPAECNLAAWMSSVHSWVNVTLIDYILTIRVLALYSQDKRLSIYLKTIFYLDALFTCTLMLYANASSSIIVVVLAEGVTACAFPDQDLPPFEYEFSLIIWVVPVAYGTLLMILAGYKGASMWKTSAGLRGLPLVRMLIRDQLICFPFAIACCVINLIQQIGFTKTYIQNAILINVGNTTFMAVLGSRMLYKIKDAVAKRQNIGTEFRSMPQTFDEIEFAVMRSDPNAHQYV